MRRAGKKPTRKDQYFCAGDAKALPDHGGLVLNRNSIQTFNMKFMFTAPELLPTNLVNYFGQSFAISSVPNITNWTINFDKFRFNSVEIMFNVSRRTENVGTDQIPNFYCAPDFDSDATPTSIAEILRKPRSVTVPFTNSFKRKFRPRVAKTIYKTGLASAYGEGDASQWVDCANADTPHFGFSYATDAVAIALQFGYRVTYVYDVTFSNPIS